MKNTLLSLLDRYRNLDGCRPLNYSNLSKKLGISFSDDFKRISDQASFDYISGFSFHGFPEGVMQETLRLQKQVGLPKDTLFLSEDDASLLLMKCLGDHEEIYWIAIEDGDRYCNGEPLQYNPTIFPTFPDFFEYLLNEEEKIREPLTKV